MVIESSPVLGRVRVYDDTNLPSGGKLLTRNFKFLKDQSSGSGNTYIIVENHYHFIRCNTSGTDGDSGDGDLWGQGSGENTEPNQIPDGNGEGNGEIAKPDVDGTEESNGGDNETGKPDIDSSEKGYGEIVTYQPDIDIDGATVDNGELIVTDQPDVDIGTEKPDVNGTASGNGENITENPDLAGGNVETNITDEPDVYITEEANKVDNATEEPTNLVDGGEKPDGLIQSPYHPVVVFPPANATKSNCMKGKKICNKPNAIDGKNETSHHHHHHLHEPKAN